MNKCLVTKLSANVSSSDLLKIGEIRMNLLTIKDSHLRVDNDLSKPITIKLAKGYFKKSYTDNTSLGNEITISEKTELFPSEVTEVSAIPKYNIRFIKNVSLNINDLKYSKDLSEVEVTATNGSLSALADNVQIHRIIIDGNYSGDLSEISNLNKIDYMSINGTGQTGDIADIKYFPSLKFFSASGLHGDIAAFKDKEFNPLLFNGNFYGDLALCNSKVKFLELYGSTCNFDWSARPSSANIIALKDFPTINNLDKMLQDEAECVAYTGDISNYKLINVKGTRTAASDTAIQKLQSKGYTVSVIDNN